MEKALKLLLEAHYDAYIEYGRLYYRTPGGGVEAVLNDYDLERLLEKAAALKRAVLGA